MARRMKNYVIESKDRKGKWKPIGIEIRAMSKTTVRKKVNSLIKREYITPGIYQIRER